MAKIAFFGVKPYDKAYLENKIREVGIDADVTYSEEIINKDNLPSETDADILSVFVNSVVDTSVMNAFPNLKCIVTRSTGFDHIDLDAAKKKGITVVNVPSYGENTVAEFAFGLILTLSRKLFSAIDQIKETGSFRVDGLQGFDLKGKTLGIVGTGRIGRHTIKMGLGFGMRVIGFDAFPNEKLAKELGFEYRSFDDVLHESDVISIHVPYMKETHHLFNKTAFQKMKKGAVLVNTSRGAVVETQALVAALKDGQLGGAGLDVLEEEGVIKDEMGFLVSGHPAEHDLKTILANHVLIDMPNVVITPHNAFNTKEALERILDTTVEGMKGFLDNAPVHVVENN